MIHERTTRDAARTAFSAQTKRIPGHVPSWHVGVATLVLLIVSYFSLSVGVVSVPLETLWNPTGPHADILWLSRIPRLCAVLLAGSSLAVAGLLMQHLTQNRFVSPTTAGTVEAAILGLLIGMVFFPGAPLMVRVGVAVVCAMVATMVFLRIIAGFTSRDVLLVALVGLIYGGVLSAISVFIALRYDLLQTIEAWTTGSFSGAIAGSYETLWGTAIVGVVIYIFANQFTIVGMGSAMASNLGVRYQPIVHLGLFLVSMVASLVIVTVGAIPFLGLIVPNLIRMWFGDNVRNVLPITALSGAALVLACDVLGRIIRYPYEIPASVIAGVIGGVVFLILLWRLPR